MKSRRSKACDIPQKVKQVVWERDNHCCIYCGRTYAMPSCHYISRAFGGLGIEQNIVTLCADCHHNTDNSSMRPIMLEFIRDYLKSKYKDWNEQDLIYKKDKL